jgi:hypothetical protein
MGYQALCAEDFADSQEPDITGELVRVMRAALESDTAPPWAEYYAIHDDPPLHVPGRRGKARPRVDIEFERIAQGIRPRLCFEAKRLGRNHGVKKYLGAEGLGCFTSGKYPLMQPEAGMLGYVQKYDEVVWASKIEAELSLKPDVYGAVGNVLWAQHRITPRLIHTYRSKHSRRTAEDDIDIFHILLRFCSLS